MRRYKPLFDHYIRSAIEHNHEAIKLIEQRSLPTLHRIHFTYEDINIYMYYYSGDGISSNILTEAKRGPINIGKGVTARKDRQRDRIDHDAYDMHFFKDGKMLYAINQDGRTRHGAQGTRVLNVIKDYMAKHEPNWKIPDYLEDAHSSFSGIKLIEQFIEDGCFIIDNC